MTKRNLTLCIVLTIFGVAAAPPTVTINHAVLSKLHWQLACQAGTFEGITFVDMVDQLHAMGVHHIELSPAQALSKDFLGVKTDAGMNGEQVDALLAKLKSVKMDVVSIGVVPVVDGGDSRPWFELAKKLKAKNLVVATTGASLESLDKLATEFGVHVALLTQPKAGDSVEETVKLFDGHSDNLGMCLDISAMKRAGVSDDAWIGKLATRIVEINLTDTTDEDHSLTSTLKQLKEKQFKGIFALGSASAGDRLPHWISSVDTFSAAMPGDGN